MDRAACGGAFDFAHVGGDEMVRRHVDLRPFAVNDGEDVWVLPGV